ncbi:tail fiber domain-containing protein [Winogradskyella sp. 4-2091]|uniref:tail fiber domain-containing protein n=1 Tax=Winogradskyella sp. 4-2091 TaxID=3381659 RepID=UPI003892BD4D
MKKLAIVIGFCLLTVISYAQVGIGNTNPDTSSALDITSTDGGLLIPRVSLVNVTNNTTPITAPATSLLVWNTNASVIGGSGEGYYYWNGTTWTPFIGSANTLDQAYDQGGPGAGRVINANAGDLEVNSGRVEFTYTADANGTIGSGVLEIGNSLRLDGNEIITNNDTLMYLQNGNNGDLSVDTSTLFVDASTNRIGVNTTIPNATLDLRGSAIFNETGGNNDFRIESDANPMAFGVDAGENVMFAGTNILSLTNNGASVNGINLEYVASFYRSAHTNGTAIQIGSTEYITDFGNLMIGPYGSWVSPIDNTYDLGTSTFRWDDVYATSGVVNTSDIRLKKNIKSLSYGLNEIMKLEPISYQWKNSNNPSEVKLGFSAQQLLKILPEVVKTQDFVYPDENEPGVLQKNENLGVYYSDIIPVLTKAIQEQNQLIEAQNKKLEKIDRLENEINELKTLLKKAK